MSCKNLMKILVLIFVVLLISTVTFADKAVMSVSSNSVSATSVTSVSASEGSSGSTSSDSSGSSTDSGSSTSSTNTGSTSVSTSSSGSTTRNTKYSVKAVSISEKDTADNSDTSGTKLTEAEKESRKKIEKKKEDNRRYIKETLKISDEVEIKENTINVLIQRKSQDYANFEKITELTTTIVEDNNKEAFVDEIITMDKYFIEELSDKVEKISEIEQIKVKKQVENYLDIVKKKETIKVEVKDKQIEDLFNKKLDIDSLIEKIWNN